MEPPYLWAWSILEMPMSDTMVDGCREPWKPEGGVTWNLEENWKEILDEVDNYCRECCPECGLHPLGGVSDDALALLARRSWIELIVLSPPHSDSRARDGEHNGAEFPDAGAGAMQRSTIIINASLLLSRMGVRRCARLHKHRFSTANQAQMFCEDCRTIERKELFSKKPHLWSWRFWRVEPIPVLLTIGISVCIPASGKVRGIVFVVIYAVLCSITPRRRNGQRVFPPYLW